MSSSLHIIEYQEYLKCTFSPTDVLRPPVAVSAATDVTAVPLATPVSIAAAADSVVLLLLRGCVGTGRRSSRGGA